MAFLTPLATLETIWSLLTTAVLPPICPTNSGPDSLAINNCDVSG